MGHYLIRDRQSPRDYFCQIDSKKVAVTEAKGKPRLLRLLFPDGARLSFTMPNSSAATPLPAESALGGQHFRLITPSGEALHRSFADPFGAEFYVATLRAMLRRHGESRKPCGDLTNFEPWNRGLWMVLTSGAQISKHP